MIRILDSSLDLATLATFSDNGLGTIQPLDGTDTEELNGMYECEFRVLTTEKHYNDLEVEGIIVAPTEKGEQMFRIYYMSKPLNRTVTVRAKHITYDLNKKIVEPFTATGAAEAVELMVSNTIGGIPFTMTTNITNTESITTLPEPKAFRGALGGFEGSLLDVFRCEYEWDNLEVKMLSRRGADNGVRIAYRKNLTGCKMDEDSSKVFTSVMCFVNFEGQLRWGNIYNKVTTQYPKVLLIDMSEKYSADAMPSVNQLTEDAQTYATNNDIEVPKISLEVNFIPLWQTEEYKNVAPLEAVQLGDDVQVDIDYLGITANMRVVKTVWNINTQRYDSIQLGSLKSSLASIVSDVQQSVENNANFIGVALARFDKQNGEIQLLTQQIQANQDSVMAQILLLSNNITSVVERTNTIESTYMTQDGVEELITQSETRTSSEIQQMADSITIDFEDYVRTDDEAYVNLSTNITFSGEGVNISSQQIETNLQLTPDGVYIRDANNEDIATMTSTQFTTGKWVLQQNDYVFNIFKSHRE